ncbi:hypothetical protein NQ314_006367 [Rhamnusium bicolor]|uniref:Uncharacterized protein n=1 Tax=Rhamnusium bicolor TaxID=1586634 RepID=A0AAV8Z3U0_9CUCU|nr:hypothetical protein NQ314_006367 [Rhamnusium bicolor]
MTDEPQDVHDGIVIGSDDSDIAGDFKMPSQEELLKVIENMPGLNEETKQELREGILRRGQLGEAAAQFLPPAKIAEENVKNTSLEVIMLLSLISFVFLVLGEILCVNYYIVIWRNVSAV